MTTLTHMTTPHRPRAAAGRMTGERGAALVVALMAMLLLSALGLSLILTTNTEAMIAGNFRSSSEALYAADPAIDPTIQDVLTVPDWNTMLTGATRSSFTDGAPN